MKYDFTSIIDRRGKDAIAVDAIGRSVFFAKAPSAPKEGFDVIPMWVADMNFATAPSITEAIINRAEHPMFGYFYPSKEYYDSIINWQRTRNKVEGLKSENIGYENGVLGCVNTAIKVFTQPGDKVLVHSPTYIGFTHSLEYTNREAELSPLYRDDEGVWRMDYEDMDRRIKENHIKLAIFCNPHNPCGRVWEPWEIEKAMEVYAANDVIVLSDEIWSDIILNGNRYTPTQSVSEEARNRTIGIYAPSKTFNLAGLIGSYHIIYNRELKKAIDVEARSTHYNNMNVLSMHALVGAYKEEGMEWVDELCEVLSGNINYAYEFICNNFEGVSTAKPEGTYMMMLHCEEFCKSRGLTIEQLIQRGWDVGVAWQEGAPFHDPWGVRMNFALPYSRVVEAMDRLKKYVFI